MLIGLAVGWFCHYRRRRRCWRRRGSLGTALFEPHDHNVEHGRKKETEAGYSEHAEEDGGAKSLTHLGTGAFAQDQREDAENEGEGRHQNRAQSETAGFNRGGETIFAIAILDVFRELNDEDGVFAGETGQHDKTDLSEDVVF